MNVMLALNIVADGHSCAHTLRIHGPEFPELGTSAYACDECRELTTLIIETADGGAVILKRAA